VPSAPGLQFRNVSRSFGAVRDLRGVTFEVTEGEALGLIGEIGDG
jgi:branched-chain amino acid transport system ATP-binding protein